MRQSVSIVEKIADFAGNISGWLVPLMMSLVVIEVFMRYVVHQPLMIADEFSAYMLVALTFLGMAYVQKEHAHVRVTILTSRLPPKVSMRLRVITLGFFLIFAILFAKSSYDYLVFSFRMQLASGTHLKIPLHGPQSTLLVGFGLLCLLLIIEFVRAVTNLRAGGTAEKGQK